ncbi:MAG: hypothetical protein A3B10_02365 [Candidatus Doudnabacteria bacterium RIFCSPLOWO2_01_FULL_44_21]|uniref:General secretion pathway GspH domain-containing protein n=1 Tax=Candidatus Doudnabacteria bacterium RIFCSPLOWO2_01_FULL_44_21 TaxID=1817841 RepID=A0A1F5PY09_9BACT|nr:MAG: hypothetical protein A3B95_02700 [Candidatus Doudnabacteria bacterium RIFCSPHIGHO2_02_FULL_43_13b]OGE94480.1 MAG: hypothetical protein A3B10_02365 [Candidatus Doudnabacteria bacterium RIFCSPLOWO2_01_FULL_44_21]
MGLVALLAGMSMFLSFDFYRGYAFGSEQSIIVSVLQKARNQAMSNINQKSHGVKFLAENYVIFQGADYTSRDVGEDQIIEASPVVNNSGGEIVFTQLSGSASNFSLDINGNGKTATITVNSEGQIDVP